MIVYMKTSACERIIRTPNEPQVYNDENVTVRHGNKFENDHYWAAEG